MAAIHLTAMTCGDGPHIPAEIAAWIANKVWPGGGTVPVLCLGVGTDHLEIWPADPERIEGLAMKLATLARKLRETE